MKKKKMKNEKMKNWRATPFAGLEETLVIEKRGPKYHICSKEKDYSITCYSNLEELRGQCGMEWEVIIDLMFDGFNKRRNKLWAREAKMKKEMKEIQEEGARLENEYETEMSEALSKNGYDLN